MHRCVASSSAALAGLAVLALTAAPAGARQVSLTAAASGTTVTVRTGDTIRVSLKANETTGYRWLVTRRPARRIARVTRSRYLEPGAGLPGQGGTQRYVLRANRPGHTRFAARYEQVGSHARGGAFSIRLRVRARVS